MANDWHVVAGFHGLQIEPLFSSSTVSNSFPVIVLPSLSLSWDLGPSLRMSAAFFLAALLGLGQAININVASSGGNKTSGLQYGLMFEVRMISYCPMQLI